MTAAYAPAAVSCPTLLLDEAGAVLAFPAATATTAQLHFAIRHSSGLIHAAMPSALLDALRVPDQQVLDAEASGTGFTVAVDAAAGIGTGISARDRAHTMRVLADPRTVAADLIRPGHVLPIRCADGGHAARPRVWELACDLVAAAGHPPVAVVCRLVSDSGDLLTGAAAESFAAAYDLPIRLS
ncbi:3,4-dihydroxy-2-butanone-4-phosphate synthase [Mycolicibacterium litorale]|uniref:3,4-dihydroxy-2-butanone-4-phosphate synthase n=1 Tax=Mycolicibacterium litorale TaxID=758802 RepID=UPI003CF5E605